MTKSELDTLFSEYDVSNIFPIVRNRTNICVEKLKELTDSDSFGKLKGIKDILT